MKRLLLYALLGLTVMTSVSAVIQWTWGGKMYFRANQNLANPVEFHKDVYLTVDNNYTVRAPFAVKSNLHTLHKNGGGTFWFQADNPLFDGNIAFEDIGGLSDTVRLDGIFGLLDAAKDSIGYVYNGKLSAVGPYSSYLYLHQHDTVVQTFNAANYDQYSVNWLQIYSDTKSTLRMVNSSKLSFAIEKHSGTLYIDGSYNAQVYLWDGGTLISGQKSAAETDYATFGSFIGSAIDINNNTTLKIGVYQSPSLLNVTSGQIWIQNGSTVEIDVYDPDANWLLTSAGVHSDWVNSYSDRIAIDAKNCNFGTGSKIKPKWAPEFIASLNSSDTLFYLPVVMKGGAGNITGAENVLVHQTLPLWHLEFIVSDGSDGTNPGWGYLKAKKILPDNIGDFDCYVTPPPTEWSIREVLPVYTAEKVHNYAPLVVGDIDGDTNVEILGFKENEASGADALPFRSFGVKIFWYNDVSKKIELKKEFPFANGHASSAAGSMAIVRYNNTGYVIVCHIDDSKLYAYDSDGNKKWESNVAINGSHQRTMVSVADFNGDGIPEVYTGNQIFSIIDGKQLCNGGTGNNMGVLPGEGYSSMAVDINSDGRLELVAGTQIYKVNIPAGSNTPGTMTLISDMCLPDTEVPNNALKDGATQVADIDDDGILEVVVMSRNGSGPNDHHVVCYVWKPLPEGKSYLMGSFETTFNSGTTQYSIPMIGNIDNDEYREIVFISNGVNKMYALKYDPAQSKGSQIVKKWDKTHSDNSGCTGMSLFDFNLDGKNEIVYRDESHLYIIDGSGSTPAVLADFSNVHSGTIREMPIIADIDWDGQAEIIIQGGIDGNAHQTGYLRVFKSNGSQWAPARWVWNQYAYNVVNINEDLTVPKYQFNPATKFPVSGKRPFNSFLQQQTVLSKDGEPMWITPDIEALEILSKNYFSPGDSLVLTMTVTNIGDAVMAAPYYISAYKNSVAAGNRIAVDSVMHALNIGDTVTVKMRIRDFSTAEPYSQIVIRLNDRGTGTNAQLECDDINNLFQFGGILAAITDTVSTLINVPVNIDPLANDSLSSCTRALIGFDTIAGSGLKMGSLVIDNNKILTYTPDFGLFGIDSVKYYLKCEADSSAANIYILTSKPLAQNYAACQNASITLGFHGITDVEYKWYDTPTGGSPVVTNTGSYTVVKDASALESRWVEPVWKGMNFPRLRVDLYKAANCDEVNPQNCAVTGSLLFREDFGGNEESDPARLGTLPVLGGTVLGHTFKPIAVPADGEYILAKTSGNLYSHWFDIGDRSFPATDRGYMMIVNASATPGEFYRTTVSGLCSGRELYFSAWIANLDVPSFAGGSFIKPELRFVLHDASTDEILVEYSAGVIPGEASAAWKHYGFNYTTVSSNNLTLKIYNNRAGGLTGNDFAIDDIEVRLCAPPVNITKPVTSDTTVCSGTTLTLNANYSDGGTLGDPLKYRWEYSATGNPNNPNDWKALGTENTASGSFTSSHVINNIKTDSAGYYRLWVTNELTEISNMPNCRAISRIIRVRVSQRLVPPDIRIHLHPPLPSTIDLSSYLDSINYSYLLQWTNLASAPAFINSSATTTGTLNVGNWSIPTGYTYRYTVETPQCGTNSAKVYVRTITKPRLKAVDTLYFCKDMPLNAYIQLKQLIGIETDNGAWSYPNDPDNAAEYNVTEILSGKFKGAHIFNAIKAFDDASDPIYDYGPGRKKFEFEYGTGTVKRKIVLVIF